MKTDIKFAFNSHKRNAKTENIEVGQFKSKVYHSKDSIKKLESLQKQLWG